MIARRIKSFCENILESKLERITIFFTLEGAEDYLDSNEIDLLLLNLNLNDRDGFDLLKTNIFNNCFCVNGSKYTRLPRFVTLLYIKHPPKARTRRFLVQVQPNKMFIFSFLFCVHIWITQNTHSALIHRKIQILIEKDLILIDHLSLKIILLISYFR